MIPQVLAAALGLWVMVSPGVLDLDDAASTSSWIVGPVVASIAYIAAWSIARGLRYLNAPLGLWLAVSPLVLGFGGAGAASAVASGLALLALSLAPSTVETRYGGGWRELVAARRGS